MLAAMWVFARTSVKTARLERSVDAALLLLLVVALSVYFVAVPGFAHGDFILTLVFVADLGAVVFATVGATMRRTWRHRKLGWSLVAACSAATLGDGFVAATASGDVHITVNLTALMWAIAGFAIAYSADEEGPELAAPVPEVDVDPQRRGSISRAGGLGKVGQRLSETRLADPPAEAAAAGGPADPAFHVALAAVLARKYLEVAGRPRRLVEPRRQGGPSSHVFDSGTPPKPGVPNPG